MFASRSLVQVEKASSKEPLRGVIREVWVHQPMVALTFDDGPDPVYTPQLLDLLKKHDARATFFVTGVQAAAFPDMVARIAAQGHQVGNHEYEHRNYRRLTLRQLPYEIEKTEQVVRRTTGRTPTVFRAPYGE